ncbi:hypothetical protein CDAR_27741 [Caerostris darwini]|uniref:PDZ domain-containing protein n=1 Tax=Caerostris darwini TaxID=1538125 RepID=A0AAV4SMZ8_9ARAC|nr:hypothetical protein CDAR_27741 [Caerostris darwini]
MGSPSEGELQRGDTILQIQGRDTVDMTHMDAHDLIKAASTRLQLLIRRLPGAPQTPLTPTSPLPTTDGMHPYAKLLRKRSRSIASQGAHVPAHVPAEGDTPTPEDDPPAAQGLLLFPTADLSNPLLHAHPEKLSRCRTDRVCAGKI